MEGTISYSPPARLLFIETSSKLHASLALNFKLLNNKLNCNLAFNDLFKRQVGNVQLITNGVRQNNINYHDTQNIKVSLNYIFGSSKVKETQRKQGNQEELKRTQ